MSMHFIGKSSLKQKPWFLGEAFHQNMIFQQKGELRAVGGFSDTSGITHFLKPHQMLLFPQARGYFLLRRRCASNCKVVFNENIFVPDNVRSFPAVCDGSG